MSPIYEYECVKCKKRQEKLHAPGKRPVVWCDRGCDYQAKRVPAVPAVARGEFGTPKRKDPK